jgi:hypothetical protein
MTEWTGRNSGIFGLLLMSLKRPAFLPNTADFPSAQVYLAV